MNGEKGHILFEKFSILEILKKNEGAAVYLAFHQFLGKKILLKVLDIQKTANELKVARFQREAKILAKLEHPNIIKVLDFGTYGNFFYLSAEYFESTNLRPLMNDHSLTLEEKRNIIEQVFLGLSYSHRHKIIHRDIKPENILINDRQEVKLSDFGLALSMNDSSASEEDSIAGTPSYMSPEQLQGEKLTCRTDLFSAGVVAYELLTGDNPFLGKNVNDTIRLVLNKDNSTIQDALKQFPGNFAAVIMPLLEKDENERTASAADVLQQLKPVEIEKPLSPAPSAETRKTRPWIYGAFAAFALSALFVFFLASGIFSNGSKSNRGKLLDKPIPILNGGHFASLYNDGNDTEKRDTAPDEDSTLLSAEDKNETEEKQENSNVDLTDGSLFVECIPWAHIEIDGKRLDTTPLEGNLALRPGTYSLTLLNPGYPPFHTKITIQPDKKTTLSVNLDNEFGTVVCKIFPWGEIYVNGKHYGQTPLESGIRLAPGTYQITVKNPNYADFSSNISIIAGKTITFKHNFAESKETKTVSTN